MRLYGTPPTRATRVLWVLRELGLDCEVCFVSLRRGDHRKPEFLALNPAARVPVLVDGDVVVTESAAIALYLAEKYPEKGLIPTQLPERAQMYRWLFFLTSEIEGPLERMERHTSLYPEDQRRPEEVALARKECQEMCAVLEKHLHGRRYLVGDRLSIADLVAAYTLDWANEVNLLDDARGLREYRQKMYALPSAPPTIAQAFAALQSGESIDWLKRSDFIR
ncbi:MAG: glutathione S-transferase family protein [Armatimonadetes bacterium]|nr:glutathione S-transferase family protein [Armatimonadota bacterium]